MSHSLPPLDRETQELLDAERRRSVSPEVLDRVWSRLVAAPSSSRAKTDGVGDGASLSSTSRVVRVALIAFAAGTGTGVMLHALVRPLPPERIVRVDVPVSAAASTIASGSEASAAPSASEPRPGVVLRTVPSLVTRAAPARQEASSLREERAVLDRARTALAEGDGAGALSLTDECARRFPHPQLGEEREALAIEALVLAGRYAEARTRAARFETVSPSSLFRPSVEAAVGSIPIP